MNGRSGIRLLVADVDGTLVTENKELTAAAATSARELQAAGIILAITSGRPPRGMRMLIEPLALKNVIAGFNGGVLVNPDLSVIESHPLNSSAAQQALKLILDQELDAWVYTEQEWFILDDKELHVAHEAHTLKFEAKVVPSFTDKILASAVKIVGVSDNRDLMAACEKTVRSALGDRVSAACSQPYFLDVTHPRANKGAVIETLSKRLNIPFAQIATIGDMPTDTLMFAKSGLSIAMGNASDEVKAQADVVTSSNENDGFAKAVRQFVLQPVSA